MKIRLIAVCWMILHLLIAGLPDWLNWPKPDLHLIYGYGIYQMLIIGSMLLLSFWTYFTILLAALIFGNSTLFSFELRSINQKGIWLNILFTASVIIFWIISKLMPQRQTVYLLISICAPLLGFQTYIETRFKKTSAAA